MKIAIYVRVSTTDQNQELQLRELQEYAARHQWGNVQIYQDNHQRGVSKQTGIEPAHGRCQSKEARHGALLEAGQVRALAARLPGQPSGTGLPRGEVHRYHT